MADNFQKYFLPALLIFGVVGLAIYLTHVMANYYSANLQVERAKFEQERSEYWSNVDHTNRVQAINARLQTKPQ